MTTTWPVLLAAGLCLVGMSGAWVQAQSERGDPSNGRRVYEQHCLRCHGEKLDGRGPEALSLITPPPDLHSPSSRSKSDWELLVPIYHGVMFTPMHGFRDRLPYDQIRDALSYIRLMTAGGSQD
jgi:mono/diheme cytochrome c family protein